MKGKSIFTENEAKKIRGLIEEKVRSSSKDQEKIRRKIRKIGFYYTDFSNKKGYTVYDFNELVESRQVSILNNKL